jgi:hypothetical protein
MDQLRSCQSAICIGHSYAGLEDSPNRAIEAGDSNCGAAGSAGGKIIELEDAKEQTSPNRSNT